jgi:hypothetical protein
MLLVSWLWVVTGCSMQKMSKYASTMQVFYNPASFTYYPAELVLQNGDTPNGRFTKIGNLFFLVHENNDSNYNKEKVKNWITPTTYYYKKIYGDSLKSYMVNGYRYEPVIITNKKTDSSYIPPKDSRAYMKRLTADNSSLHLYQHLVPKERNEEEKFSFIGVLVDMFFNRYDTTINGHDFYFSYYLHFPGEYPAGVWSLSTQPVNKPLQEKLITTFSGCPALAPAINELQQMRKTDYFITLLARPDSIIKTTGVRALLERIEKYNDCYKIKSH